MTKNFRIHLGAYGALFAATTLLVSTAGLTAAQPGDLAGPPRLDMLEDAAIVHHGGVYYLTGTAGTFDNNRQVDFAYNRGAPLFRSNDLQSWENLGYMWDRFEHYERTNGRPPKGIWTDWAAPAEEIDALLSQATTHSRLYEIDGKWYLLCSMNNQNLLVQRSTSGKPEGPYDDYAYLVTRAPDASLFFDDDGSVYLIYAEGWIAPVKRDLSALLAPPKPIAVQSTAPGQGPLFVGERGGVALFKRDGSYHLLAPRHVVRKGQSSHDAFLWVADNVAGPYRLTNVVLEGSGPVSVFQTPNGEWGAVSGLPTGANGPRFIQIPSPVQ